MTAFTEWAHELSARLPQREPKRDLHFRDRLAKLGGRYCDWAVAPIAGVTGTLILGFRPKRGLPITYWPIVDSGQMLANPVASSSRSLLSAYLAACKREEEPKDLIRDREPLLALAAALGDEAVPEIIARLISGELNPSTSIAEAYLIAEGPNTMLSRYHTDEARVRSRVRR